MRHLKNPLLFILILLFTSSYSQINFDTIPLNRQLVGRDLNTNLGSIIISGKVNNASVSYDSILLVTYRNNVQNSSAAQALIYDNNIAAFTFNTSIVAELANYSLKIYGKTGSELTLEKTVDSIVAGDVFIIQGQSNAEARMLLGSSNHYQHDFIRVYSNGTHFPNEVYNNNKWYIGQGDGNRNTNGNTGQWGLKLARMIIDSVKIPVAIFNAGHGGKEIDFFPAPPDYKTSLESNYGRLYYRINKTRLKSFIRAVFWSQGEWDGEDYGNTSTDDYKNSFLSLKSDWLNDYPNIQHFYLFQTKNGCGGDLNKIKEAQRQLAFENQDISIMSTAALIHFNDECHFPFADGYEVFADRIFPLVQGDLYDMVTPDEINPPMILSAKLINETTLVVETDASELSINTTAEDFLLTNAESSEITKVETSSNKIIFTLSKYPGTGAIISYLAQDVGIGHFITNQRNLELVCFYQYPISIDFSGIVEAGIEAVKVYPNPANDVIYLSGIDKSEIIQINIFNKLGQKEIQLTNDFEEINVSNLKYGIHFLEVKTRNSSIKKKILIIE